MPDDEGWKPATKFPDLFAALVAPFDSTEVKVRSQSGRQLQYITARSAMNRLDNVVGPENWWDSYVPHENSVLCTLTIRLPDGSTLTKQDAGGYAGMADHGDDDKSGYSDAFKRACAKFGVARYLYRDGVPSYATMPSEPPATVTNYSQSAPPANGDARTPTAPAASLPNPPRSGKALFKMVKALEESNPDDFSLIKPLNDWARKRGVNDRMTDWPEHFIAEAWAFVSGLVPAGDVASPEPAEERPAGSIKELRDDFYRLCYSIVVKVFDLRGEPEIDRIKEECNRVAGMLTPGRTIATFADLKDADDLRALVATATERYREVMTAETPF